MASYVFPEFDDLPRIEGQVQGCLWGFFDKDGRKDQLGSKSVGHLATCTSNYQAFACIELFELTSV